MSRLIRFLVEHSLVVNLVSIFLVFVGLFAAVNINREAFPNVNLDLIQIEIRYPGATPEEIARLAVTPIEQELKQLSGIDKMLSVSFPSSGRITLELDPYATNRDRLVSDVQLAVDRAKLPSDLEDDPVVTEIDGTVFPVIQLAVSAPLSELELKRLGDRLEDELLQLDGVAKVVVQGERNAEIRVVVDPERMKAQRVSVGELTGFLNSWNVSTSGGDIDTPEGQKAVRIAGEFRSPGDVAGLVLRANERGEGIRLGDIAAVTESLERPRVHHDVQGKPALALLVLKKSDADIIDVVDRVNEWIDTVAQRHGADVRIDTFQDFSRFARLRLGVLTNNALVGLVLVFLSLLMFLRPSVALTTTWGLPIVFLTGLYVLYLSGITLNLISMFGFIMVLGMLVDDAIIIGENITYHMEQGMAPREAAVLGASELLGPVTTTVMTTIAAFLPLMFMSGIIGKFIVAIPTVVITLLVLSWLESFLVLPGHVADVTNPHRHPRERAWLRGLENAYGWVLKWALKLRWLTLAASFALLAGSGWLAATKLQFQLFPPSGVDEYVVRVTAPPGTSLEGMRRILQELDADIRTRVDPDMLETTLLQSGQIALDEGDPLVQRGDRFGQIRVIYTPSVLRPDHDAVADMRRLEEAVPGRFPDLELGFTEIRPGPPVGRPLQVEIFSYDQAATDAAAGRLIDYVAAVDGVTAVESGLRPGDPELHVVVDRALAAYAGIDLATVASHVRAAVDGLRVSTVRRGTEEVDVTIRFPEDRGARLDQLRELLLPNERGGLVPLNRIARLEEQPGFTTVRHKAGIRVVNVVADIDFDVITSAEINRLVAQHESQWLGDAAGRVKVNYGGEEEKNQESVVDLAKSMGYALLGIFFLLAIQFNRLSYPFIVMLAIPFGSIGIVLSFYFHDMLWRPMPLSFMALMGMVALAGVVVNSALVLLVFIQREVAAGTPHVEAILLAGRRRLRAVVLTATTTVVGLLPTAYGWGGMDPFVAPMALALSWGLAFATVITLITIPSAYAAALDVRHVFRLALGRSG